MNNVLMIANVLRLDFNARSQKLLDLVDSGKESISFGPSSRKELRFVRTIDDVTCPLVMFQVDIEWILIL